MNIDAISKHVSPQFLTVVHADYWCFKDSSTYDQAVQKKKKEEDDAWSIKIEKRNQFLRHNMNV